jgi:hypothetical protein
LAADLKAKGVDLERTLSVLDLISNPSPVLDSTIPDAGDRRVIDRTGFSGFEMDRSKAESRLRELDLPRGCLPERRIENRLLFNEADLRRIGTLLYPRVAYGVLNGGSATTYIDRKKNRELDAAAFDIMQPEFETAAAFSKDAPKGITPAFVRTDGTRGPSFLLLKMRSLLLRAAEYRDLSGDRKTPVLPFFQMTSAATDAPLRDAYRNYAADSLIAPLMDRTGVDPTRPLGEVQPLLAAITHSGEGTPRRIFGQAYGKAGEGIALPGGHGENFRVLAPVYRNLRARGIKWAFLGNVDNSGYTVDPVSVALTALDGANAAFEFSWKTPMDVKGGILVERSDGRLSVGEIGQSLAKARIAEAENAGNPILFNCATGLFDLDYLVPRLERIADELPIRVSDQDKEPGRYAQAEQNTWDILGLIDRPLVFAVAKERRFIAAKMLIETLLAGPSGAKIEGAPGVDPGLAAASARIRKGFASLLKTEFGMEA